MDPSHKVIAIFLAKKNAVYTVNRIWNAYKPVSALDTISRFGKHKKMSAILS